VKKGTKKTQIASKTSTRSVLEAKVSDVEIVGDRWMAATSNGLYFSKDQGRVGWVDRYRVKGFHLDPR